jgi:hypothetical protein
VSRKNANRFPENRVRRERQAKHQEKDAQKAKRETRLDSSSGKNTTMEEGEERASARRRMCQPE